MLIAERHQTSRIAVVNRGDAAMRLIQAVREYNLQHDYRLTTIALTTDDERDSTFAREADERFNLGPAFAVGEDGERRLAYLDLNLLRRALLDTRVDAVWVGWGFVSELPEFAVLCDELGVRLLGPSAATMRQLGDKIGAKNLAESVEVPIVPWSGGPVADLTEAEKHCDRIGFPLMVKAAAGGGGRGIRRVDDRDSLGDALQSAQREALSAFGDDTVFLERAVSAARHVEVQVAADEMGTVWAVGIRDCSVQRRRQKIVEESGIPGAPTALVDEIQAAAVRLIRAVDYVGLATVEFLLDGDEFYFMEVNTRLQVEHTVTEEVSGIDLVKLQLELGFGGHLSGEPPAATGYAIEARITAEDVTENFRPAPGRILHWRPALGPGLRMDTGIRVGDVMPAEFDPLLVKIIARGSNRDEALARLRRGIIESRLVVESGATTLGFLEMLLAKQEVASGQASTDYVDSLVESGAPLFIDRSEIAVIYVAAVLTELQWISQQDHLFETARLGRAEVMSVVPHDVEIRYRGIPYRFSVRRLDTDLLEVTTSEGPVEVATLMVLDEERIVRVGKEIATLSLLTTDDTIQVTLGGTTYRIAHGSEGVITSPLPAVILDVCVGVGDRVATGDLIAVLESMKLEMPLRAEQPGIVQEVFVPANAQVVAGEKLLRIAEDAEVVGAESEDAISQLSFERFVQDETVQGSRLDDALRQIFGFDSVNDAVGRTFVGAHEESRLPDQVRFLELFGRCASVTGLREFSDETQRPIRARDAFARLLAAPERAGDAVPADYLVELEGLLGDFGIESLSEPGAREVLFRIARAGSQLQEVEPIAIEILRWWLEDATTRENLKAEVEADIMAQIALGCEANFPVVSDLVWTAQRHIWLHPMLASEQGTFDLIENTTISVGARLNDEIAERLELWRFSNFDLQLLTSRGDVHLFALQAKDYVADQRLVAVAGIPESDVTVRGVEKVLFEAFAQIREQEASVPLTERSMLNRVVLYVEGEWKISSEDLQQATRRLAPLARNLGIEKVIARVHVLNEHGELVEKVLHLTGPATTGLMLGVTDPSDEPLRTMSPRKQKLVKLRRRGLTDPFEIAELMTSRHAEISDFPPGVFREFDLNDSGDLVEVDRPEGENVAGVVVGIITNFTNKHPEGMTRVAILGDPSRGLGALAEAECRRIEAALDLAHERQVPVEWFTVSSGAKVSMDSGTENLDWTARVLKKIVEFTQNDGEINMILTGVNVGAQSYYDAEATMLMHTRGILIMSPRTSMVLTGKDALDFAGAVSAEDNIGVGGHDRIMGPNGQSQYLAESLPEACAILFSHYDHAYLASGESLPRATVTTDERDRDITTVEHPPMKGIDFTTIGQAFTDEHNSARNKPFDMRTLMGAVIDKDHQPLERWQHMLGAEGAIVWDAHLDGLPVSLLGIESRPLPRVGEPPTDGPGFWSAGTLFPGSSKKLARAINAASGNRPVVVLANLAGFDGSPESLRELQLEYGAELGRAVINFRGAIVFCVVSRYHGGAFVVFSKSLNEGMEVLALEGSRASVIGGSAAAAVVFGREVEKRVSADQNVIAAETRVSSADDIDRAIYELELEKIKDSARNEVRKELATEFDRIHSVERAVSVGSVDRIIEARNLRRELIESLERKLGGPWQPHSWKGMSHAHTNYR